MAPKHRIERESTVYKMSKRSNSLVCLGLNGLKVKILHSRCFCCWTE